MNYTFTSAELQKLAASKLRELHPNLIPISLWANWHVNIQADKDSQIWLVLVPDAASIETAGQEGDLEYGN